jgi:hypothetical protein
MLLMYIYVSMFVIFSVFCHFLDVKLLGGVYNSVIVSRFLVVSETESIKMFDFKAVVLKLWVYNFRDLF